MKRYWLIFLWISVVFYPEDCIWAKKINTSDHGVTIKYNQTIMVPSEGLFIRFDDVKEDSRCPRGVNCFWEGNAKVVIEVYKKDMEKTMLQINSYRKPKEAIYEEYKIRFLDLSPYPEAEKTIKMSEYMLQLNIEKEKNYEK